MAKETPQERNARMQAAFNKATTSEKKPLAQTDTYRTGTVFDYTRPEFPSMLKPEAREKLWKTKIKVSESVDRSVYNVALDRININPSEEPIGAEHESIHALSIGGGNIFERIARKADPLFWKNLTSDQQKSIKQYYGVTNTTGLKRVAEEVWWLMGRNQEAPAVLWESVKGNPKAVSLYSAAVPFFQKYFRSEFFE